MSVLDLRALLGALREADVEAIVIGGVAVAAHGYVRATADLDIVPASDVVNLKRLTNALPAMESTLPTADGRRFDAERDGSALQRGANATLDTRHGGLDIVQRVPGVPGFAALDGGAITTDLLGVSVKVCSLADLRTMKRARGSSQDRADLERLPED